MGEPMAANVLRARGNLVVWNRSPQAARRLQDLGAQVAPTPAEVLGACDPILLMLADLDAIHETLGWTGEEFRMPVTGRTLVNMGTIAPADSARLGEALRTQGAIYVEAPVSGSRVPAENGTLVSMLAGPALAVEAVAALLGPLCRSVFRCGEVPRALTTKLAVNVFLIDMLIGLAEATRFAECQDLDLDVFRAVLDSGPMASDVSRVKIAKLVADDRAPQATVRDVRYNSRLILDQARRTGLELPLVAASERLLGATEELGHRDDDVVAVLQALRAPTRPSQG